MLLELVPDVLDVGLSLGASARNVSLHQGSREGATRVVQAVLNNGDHAEVGDADHVSAGEFAAVEVEVRLDKGEDLLLDGTDGFHLGHLLVIRGKQDATHTADNVAIGVDDWVDQAGRLPVLGVVVAELDAKHAHDGAKLLKLHLPATHGALDDGHAAHFAAHHWLLLWPLFKCDHIFLVRLAMVLEHLSDTVASATGREVRPVDGFLHDALLGAAGGSGGVGTGA